jgi:hypothetical protein
MVNSFFLSKLIDFDVDYVDGNGELFWNTASEFNTDYFDVERSLDGKEFGAFARVDAAGFSTSELHYSYKDLMIADLGVERIYYRLRMVDNNGEFTYSPVRWIELEESSNLFSVTIFPNPFDDQPSLNINVTERQQAFIELTDISGRVIHKLPAELQSGNNFILIQPTTQLSAGIYYVSIRSGYFSNVLKAVKQ